MPLPLIEEGAVEASAVGDAGQSIGHRLHFQNAIGPLQFDFRQFSQSDIVVADDDAQAIVDRETRDANAEPGLLRRRMTGVFQVKMLAAAGNHGADSGCDEGSLV